MYADAGRSAKVCGIQEKTFFKEKTKRGDVLQGFSALIQLLFSPCQIPARFLLLRSVSLPDAVPNAFFNATQRISAFLCGADTNK